tara:strand:- start:4953 stop:5177 length:225 start_codon:yes stop_codon:yes gene_type:complete
MIERAIKSGTDDPTLASRLAVYSLSVGMGISPLEVYNMPSELFKDMLMIHNNVEKYKAEKMEEENRKARSKFNR